MVIDGVIDMAVLKREAVCNYLQVIHALIDVPLLYHYMANRDYISSRSLIFHSYC